MNSAISLFLPFFWNILRKVLSIFYQSVRSIYVRDTHTHFLLSGFPQVCTFSVLSGCWNFTFTHVWFSSVHLRRIFWQSVDSYNLDKLLNRLTVYVMPILILLLFRFDIIYCLRLNVWFVCLLGNVSNLDRGNKIICYLCRGLFLNQMFIVLLLLSCYINSY